MKIFLTFLILLFPSLLFADDITDFEIGGMSIGDSLLNYFSKYEIENALNYDDYPSDMKFRIIELESKDELYDIIQFYYIPDDENFIIQSLDGRKDYNYINDCYKKMNEIVEIFSALFKNSEIIDQDKTPHYDDSSGKSTYTGTYFLFDKGGRASVTCYDWDINTNFSKNIGVSIQSESVSKWIDSNYGLN